MPYPRIPYMHWAKTHGSAGVANPVDLANSGMPAPATTLRQLGIDPEALPVSGDNAYGLPPLQEALAERYGVHPTNVLTTQGTSMANYLLIATLINPGDTLLVETPVYQCLSYPPAALGAKVVPFVRREQQRWLLDVDSIVALAEQHKARAVLLSNPHNPTGACDTEDTLIDLAERLPRGTILIVDEVYREWLEGERARTVALKHPGIVVTTSLTKVWGLGGLRAGWMFGAEDLITHAHEAYDHMGVETPFPTEWIMAQLFLHPERLDTILSDNMTSLMHSRKLIEGMLTSDSAACLSTHMPRGGGFALLRHSDLTGEEVADALLHEQGVMVVSGHFFGVPEGFRLAWTRGPEVVKEGVERMANWLNRG